MSTVIRPSISKNNPYYISKHRYYELKHYCLQYPEWKKELASIGDIFHTGDEWHDPTGNTAVYRACLIDKIKSVERAANCTDEYLGDFIFLAVTQDYSYTYLSTKLGMACGKDMYYDRYRKFFYILSSQKLHAF